VGARGALWTCRKCGRSFVGKNIWHACGSYSVEGSLDGKGARARELFEGFERLIAACGPYEVAPAKTRVAFMGRVRFAGVHALSDRGMTSRSGCRTLFPTRGSARSRTTAEDGTGTGCESPNRRSSMTSCSAGSASPITRWGCRSV